MMKVTRNHAVVAVKPVIKVVQSLETIEVSPESFTLEFKNKEALQFLAFLIGGLSLPVLRSCGVTDEAGRELQEIYFQTVGSSSSGIKSKEFDAKVVKKSNLCGGCR